MEKTTATSAEKHCFTITFKDDEHAAFFWKNFRKYQQHDVYHMALIYCLGINTDTRRNIHRIYDFQTGLIKPGCLREGWQTSGSLKVVRLAFNLYTGGIPSIYHDLKEEIDEAQLYSVTDIFCTNDARYFWEAIKIRFPNYCFDGGTNDVENPASGYKV